MTAPILSSGLLTSALLLFTACIVDVGRSATSASATEGRSPPWAVTLQRQGSIAGSGFHEISENGLRPDDLLFSSDLDITSLGIRAFSASFANHVAPHLDKGQIVETTGAGAQVISVQQALTHSDKLFAFGMPDLTPDQAAVMKNFARQIKDSGHSYHGII